MQSLALGAALGVQSLTAHPERKKERKRTTQGRDGRTAMPLGVVNKILFLAAVIDRGHSFDAARAPLPAVCGHRPPRFD